MLGPSKGEPAETVDLRRTEGPVELEGKEPAGNREDRPPPEHLRGRRLTEALGDETEIVLDQVDVGDAQTVEIPVIQKLDERRLLHPTEKMIAGTKVSIAELPAVERDAPHIDTAVLDGMKETSHTPLRGIEETHIFAAVDHVEAPGLILLGPDRPGEGRQVFSPPHVAAEPLRTPPQTIPECLRGTVDVVIDTAARPAGLAGVRLAEVYARFVRHCVPRMFLPQAEMRPKGASFPLLPVPRAIYNRNAIAGQG